MGRPAKVTSIEAVRRLSAALRLFQAQANGSLEEINLQLHRAVQWVSNDQKLYWKDQRRKASQDFSEAKINLQRCLTFRTVGDHRPACTEEKKAVERAKRRVRLSEEKSDAVRHWSQLLDRASVEYRGAVSQLSGWLETECPKAVAMLDRVLDTLDDYLAAAPVHTATDTSAPAGAGRSATAGDADEDTADEQASDHTGQDEETERTGQPEQTGDESAGPPSAPSDQPNGAAGAPSDTRDDRPTSPPAAGPSKEDRP